MPPKATKAAIQDALEDLPEKKLKKFCMVLLDRRGEPRVKTSAVEGKDCITIAQVLVSTFTELGALQITLELLREIDCNEEAERLERDSKAVSSASACTQGPSAGASAGRYMSGDKHFVDKHRTALIQRVSTVPSLLDELLGRGVIKQEGYNTIMAQATSQAMMRELYKGPLNACGSSGKDIFYEILEELEPFLISDLKKLG
ncbi:apoptosis-associated speck-like protein containing a CARD isoform X2 [Myripristis murdjan]|uniref:apoptosis-associated speck-like protein containing a CARD isoform X2 n=1 Tax=Myripristis murdjan TaxID=586833 RepID=UPI001175E910|nr:apoptosis-associated speck-like protein containing a CARD isoform X2 [Myripristis murdjan]